MNRDHFLEQIDVLHDGLLETFSAVEAAVIDDSAYHLEYVDDV